MSDRQLEETIDLLKTQLLIQPNDPYKRFRLGVAYSNYGNPIEAVVNFERAIPCGLVVNELVSNAFKHAFPDDRAGEIRIELGTKDGQAELLVADNGVGLAADFDLTKVKSLGLQLVPLLVEQLSGTFTVEPGPGARFCLRFPSDAPRRAAS